MSVHFQARGESGSFAYDFSFESGEGVTAVFGRSGAGKSTLASVLGGFLRPDVGRAVVNGQVLFDVETAAFLPPSKRRIGTVFQDSHLFPHLNVKHNLTFSRWAGGRKSALSFDGVVELLGLEGLLARKPATLSGGERQRVAIGRALLSDPALLLMDEPLANLDFARRAEILPFLQNLVRAVAVPLVYITHSVDEVMRLADHLILIENGQVTDHGALAPMLARVALPDATGRAIPRSVLPLDQIGTRDKSGGALCNIGRQDVYLPIPVGGLSKGRLIVSAQDVALSLSQLVGTSHQCFLYGLIEQFVRQDNAIDVHIRVEGHLLVARITVRAYEKLGLSVGAGVYAHMKSIVFGGG